MEVNEKFGERERYTLKKFIGRGTYAEVWLALDNDTNIEVALKIYAPATGLDDYGLNVFAHEFSIVAGVNDSNLLIPKHYDSFDRRPFLVLPYCEKGSIKSMIGNTTEEQAWDMLLDVAKGLRALHSMTPPIIHQDIKPDNIMIGNNSHYLISDFGVSAHLHSTLRKSVSEAFASAGTRAYMATERFSRHNAPVMASDIWSLGSSIYEMVTGDVPFGNDGGLLQKSGAETPELDGDFSPEFKQVIDRCLAANPWDRPTAEQLVNICETYKNKPTPAPEPEPTPTPSRTTEPVVHIPEPEPAPEPKSTSEPNPVPEPKSTPAITSKDYVMWATSAVVGLGLGIATVFLLEICR